MNADDSMVSRKLSAAGGKCAPIPSRERASLLIGILSDFPAATVRRLPVHYHIGLAANAATNLFKSNFAR
jgi:hypothetical protein